MAAKQEHPTPADLSEELDELTLARAKRGEAAARAALIRVYQARVYALASRMSIARPALADDVAQDAFVKVLEALPRFDARGPAKLSTWILTITARTAIDALRKTKRLATDALSEEQEAPDDLSRDVEQRELEARVRAAMIELADDQRAVLVLRAYHELEYPEIAAALEIEEGTVKSRLSRARQALRAALEKRGVKR